MALMSTDRWHFWGHTDLALLSSYQHDSSRGEKCRKQAFPCLHVI
ncbi:unnamed protein product, partial [Staurois parvus]